MAFASRTDDVTVELPSICSADARLNLEVLCQSNRIEDEQYPRGALNISVRIGLWLFFVLSTAGAVSLLVYRVVGGQLEPTGGADAQLEEPPRRVLELLKVLPWEPGRPCARSCSDDKGCCWCCCICCGEEYLSGALMMKTPCGHYFHKDCLQRWLCVRRTCPICRLDFEETAAAEF
ncbi:unnamed protein product [Polarella glacialis]|nr:unnamed protein product [Polarella glacialis]